jgi:hypothetical protein
MAIGYSTFPVSACAASQAEWPQRQAAVSLGLGAPTSWRQYWLQ